MLKMMLAFFKDVFKYRRHIRKEKAWIQKYISKKGYSLNPDWMMRTNLEIWLAEMEEIFGKRYCPCFEPSGDSAADRKMLCPCKYIDDEISEYGTCHCALFGAADLSKEEWKKSSKRLQAEYRVPIHLDGNLLDTRGMPLDKRRKLPVPDAMHQVKTALQNYRGEVLNVIVEREQEMVNLRKIAAYRGLKSEGEKRTDNTYRIKLKRS